MNTLQPYRDTKTIQSLVSAIKKITTRHWRIMEVCGGQTHSIIKYGIDELLKEEITLIHGPGCPVCVTPLSYIDKALAIATQKNVIFCSFGDMLRVPGSQSDLLQRKAQGADIRIVYSPLDSLKIAQDNPNKEVVFFGVGFETTAPTTALTIYQAKQQNLTNFSLLISHVLVPPIMQTLLNFPNHQVQGFLGAGHVCSVMGFHEYEPLAQNYRVPIVITGFEPVDVLQGIFLCIQQLEKNRHTVENAYSRIVSREGNKTAQTMLKNTFCCVDREWRGLGSVPLSGLALNENYAAWNAEKKFEVAHIKTQDSQDCQSGNVLQGLIKPFECPAFGKHCTPEKPLGATMVSSEGACAAYYRYRNQH